MNSSYNLLDSAENLTNFYLVTIIATTMFSLSCLGALYIFYRTYIQWINSNDFIFFNKRSLNMSYKLPFYTASIDLIENAISLLNILHTAIYAQVFEDPACKIISIILWGFATLNLSLYIIIALATYFRVCHDLNKICCFGKYDYKLWLSTFILSSIFQIINMNNHGARKYWCSGKSGQIISSIILFCLIIITLIIILFCYINVLLKLNSLDMDKKYQKVSKKIINYILIFFIHWIPIVIQNLGRFLKVEHPWLYILKSTGHAMGAIGNAIIYIINEGCVAQTNNIQNNARERTNNQTDDRSDNRQTFRISAKVIETDFDHYAQRISEIDPKIDLDQFMQRISEIETNKNENIIYNLNHDNLVKILKRAIKLKKKQIRKRRQEIKYLKKLEKKLIIFNDEKNRDNLSVTIPNFNKNHIIVYAALSIIMTSMVIIILSNHI